jgi:hypothetical protein
MPVHKSKNRGLVKTSQMGRASAVKRVQHLGLTLALALCPQLGFAALGGDLRSVSADRETMQGRLQSTPLEQYELHQITTGGGTVIHEYMTLQGKVFAVTWRGPFPPNLQQLFGSYYKQFEEAVPAATQLRISHRMLRIAQPDFAVQEFARMRFYQGKACVPSLVPPGVSIGALP